MLRIANGVPPPGAVPCRCQTRRSLYAPVSCGISAPAQLLSIVDRIIGKSNLSPLPSLFRHFHASGLCDPQPVSVVKNATPEGTAGFEPARAKRSVSRHGPPPPMPTTYRAAYVPMLAVFGSLALVPELPNEQRLLSRSAAHCGVRHENRVWQLTITTSGLGQAKPGRHPRS